MRLFDLVSEILFSIVIVYIIVVGNNIDLWELSFEILIEILLIMKENEKRYYGDWLSWSDIDVVLSREWIFG